MIYNVGKAMEADVVRSYLENTSTHIILYILRHALKCIEYSVTFAEDKMYIINIT